jgi:hypothetical protein
LSLSPFSDGDETACGYPFAEPETSHPFQQDLQYPSLSLEDPITHAIEDTSSSLVKREKVIVKNTCGLIRLYIHKKANIAGITAPQVRKIERSPNGRPRKCLGYQTNNENNVRRHHSPMCAAPFPFRAFAAG